MPLQAASIIAGTSTPGTAGQSAATNPRTGETLEPAYSLISEEQLRAATAAAAEAFPAYAALAPEERARFLETAADEIEAVREEIIERAMAETGLPQARLTGEVGRTTGQLRLFARVVRQGDALGVRIDPALPDRKPLARPDIRQLKVPLGPVAVFGASNFPLAFSVAGGDTASALAAGCPVVVKAHNAHPGTSELVGQALTKAVAACGLPAGVFSLVYGPGAQIGQALVTDPAITAVGFTGSRSGGLALVAAAQARPVPIPVYAEMSSVNPVIVLPGALRSDETAKAVAEGYLGAVTGSSGQLCTSPGLLFVPTGEAGDALVAAVAALFGEAAGQTMLTPDIAQAWHDGVDKVSAASGVQTLATGSLGDGENAPAPTVFETSLDTLDADPVVADEIFGAASTVVRWSDVDELAAALGRLEGQLTATLHLDGEDEQDLAAGRALVPVLVSRAGRLIVGGWPTGVDVGDAMVHGGPFPATSDGRTTSVGTLAIDRFLRPVAFQGFPDALLPEPLRADNPWGVSRLVDGTLTLGDH